MGRIIKVRMNWTGLQGGNGYSNFYFEPVPEGDAIQQSHVDAAVSKVETFQTAVKPYRPVGVFCGVDSQVIELDEVTGAIEGFWNATVAAPVAGTASNAPYSAASGACISWATQGVRKNRRVKGKTFLVPLASAGLDVNGTIDNLALTALRTAANNLHADGPSVRLVIYARTPKAIIPDGGAYDVISASIQDKVAVLTSRR